MRAKLGGCYVGNNRWDTERTLFIVNDLVNERADWEGNPMPTSSFNNSITRTGFMIERPEVDYGEG
jgi:hypothetical protein